MPTDPNESKDMLPLLELPPRFYGSAVTFWVLNRRLAGLIAPDDPYLVISITNPGLPPTALRESPHCLGVLRLEFHDADNPADSRHRAASPENAQAIVEFVRSHTDRASVIVCQCEAGVSRSAGVAAALSRWLNGQDEFFFTNYCPNPLIYALVNDAIAGR